jgi:pyridoxal 5'-phosphate synthase pdxT subunit
MKVGVLALQGSFRDHMRMLKSMKVNSSKVKSPLDLMDIDALIIPGGESTTMSLLAKKYKLDSAIKRKYKEGMPIYGTCAGAILLSNEIIDGKNQGSLQLADIAIKRNDYGRQIDSFEVNLSIKGIGNFNGIFIRSPTIKRFNNSTEILSEYNNHPVMIRQDRVLVSTFHPELTNNTRIHEYFLEMAKEYRNIRESQKDLEKNIA